LAEHWVRTVLTVIGISLGVTTVVCVTDLGASILASFRDMVRTVAGASELEVTSPAGPVDEATIATVAATPGVAVAAGLIERFLPVAGRGDETVLLLGADFLGSPIWEEALPRAAFDLPDELVFVAQPDSVVLTRALATRMGTGPDGTFDVVTAGGVRTLRVRGLLGDAPAAHLFDGALAVMDLPAAQRLLGREGQVDRIAVQVAPGEDVAQVRRRLAAALGPALAVETPESRGRQVDQLLFSLRSMLLTASSLAVIVGAFLVFHAVAVSLEQRRREFALLNTVGVERRALVRLGLLETLALAAAGVVLGLGGGRLLAAAALGAVGTATSELWLHLKMTRYAISPAGTGAAVAIGLATAVASALLAIRATFRAPTVEALRPTGLEVDTSHARMARAVPAVLLIAATWLALLIPAGVSYRTVVVQIVVTQAIAYAAVALLAPALVGGAGAGARRLSRGSRSLPLRLAADNLPRTPGRSGMTVATIAAALGLAVGVATLVKSFETAWLDWIDQHFSGDVFVGAGDRFRVVAGEPMREEIASKVAALPSVASVEPFRIRRIEAAGGPVFLQGLSIDDRLAHGGLPMVSGDFAVAAPALRAGRGVLLSDNLAYRRGLGRGDEIELPSPGGPRRYRIEGTFVDYLGSLDLGSVVVAREQMAAVWHDRDANLLRVWLVPGTSPGEARAAILASLGPGYYAVTARAFLDTIRDILGKFFLTTWALVFVSALVGVIGIVNAQLATVLDRSTEIAMLRTIGVSRRDVTRATVLECAALGALGSAAGVAMGTMLGAHFLQVSLRRLTGWLVPFTFPTGPVVTSVAIATVVAAVAAWVPARVATNLEARLRSSD
jgi:putative ABC transport system permease protein